MQGTFLDTNIFLRHLTNDEPVQSPAARELIRAVEQGRLTAWTTALVVAEMVFILSNPKTYHVERARIRELLLPLLSLPHLKLEHKRLYPRIFDLYVALPIDYVDCYHAVLVGYYRQDTLYSFDTDFDKVTGLKRQEPSPLPDDHTPDYDD